MSVRVELRSGVYRDSVVLMQVSQAVAACRGVEAAIVAMATPLNIELYGRLGFDPAEVAQASPNDLLVAVRGDDEALLAAAAELERRLTPPASPEAEGFGSPPAPRTLASALRHGGSLALISVPGQHAFVEAMDAVQAGVSVMLFSDNVSIDQEIALKDEAVAHDVLVMGPDCGTAVVGGIGLGFANALRPGPVGIVAASGTGAQQVSCLLDAAEVGVTAVLGVGGRDLSAAVGGRSTLAAMQALDDHPGTEFIVILSKPPDPTVAETVRAAASRLRTPSLVALVARGEGDLTAATARILAALGRTPGTAPEWAAPYDREPRPGFVRGLFAGGTLCDEAMAIAAARLGPIASNTPLEAAWALGADLKAAGHLMIDFGDDRLTAGRAAPDDRPDSSPGTDRPGGRRPGLCGPVDGRGPRLRRQRGSGLRARPGHRRGPRDGKSERSRPGRGRLPVRLAGRSPGPRLDRQDACRRRCQRAPLQRRRRSDSGGPHRGSSLMINLDEPPDGRHRRCGAVRRRPDRADGHPPSAELGAAGARQRG